MVEGKEKGIATANWPAVSRSEACGTGDEVVISIHRNTVVLQRVCCLSAGACVAAVADDSLVPGPHADVLGSGGFNR